MHYSLANGAMKNGNSVSQIGKKKLVYIWVCPSKLRRHLREITLVILVPPS